MISKVGAVLIISADAAALADFYRDALGLPLQDEVHEGVPLHYGCEIGDIHLAIHDAAHWKPADETGAGGMRVAFEIDDAAAVAAHLRARGVECTGPSDHGFALTLSLRDPDGNHVELLQPTG